MFSRRPIEKFIVQLLQLYEKFVGRRPWSDVQAVAIFAYFEATGSSGTEFEITDPNDRSPIRCEEQKIGDIGCPQKCNKHWIFGTGKPAEIQMILNAKCNWKKTVLVSMALSRVKQCIGEADRGGLF